MICVCIVLSTLSYSGEESIWSMSFLQNTNRGIRSALQSRGICVWLISLKRSHKSIDCASCWYQPLKMFHKYISHVGLDLGVETIMARTIEVFIHDWIVTEIHYWSPHAWIRRLMLHNTEAHDKKTLVQRAKKVNNLLPICRGDWYCMTLSSAATRCRSDGVLDIA